MTKKIVMVSGVSSGFGFRTCQKLVEAGHHVVGTMRNLRDKNARSAERLESSVDSASGKLFLVEMDVTDDQSVAKGTKEAVSSAGEIEVLVNNAGIGLLGVCEGFTGEQVRRIMDTNVAGSHRVTRAVLPAMRNRKNGLIIYTGSIMGRIVVPFSAPYTASKFAIEGMAEGLAYELKGSGVDVAILQPGGFPTEILDKSEGPADSSALDQCKELCKRNDDLWKMWFGMLEEASPDIDLIANAVQDLILADPQDRPLRKIVDPVTGGEPAKTLNTAASKVQRELLDGIGYGDMFRE